MDIAESLLVLRGESCKYILIDGGIIGVEESMMEAHTLCQLC